MQNYNLTISSTVLDEDTTEPVSVQDCKKYMRLEGFQDVDESASTEFTEDDDLIEMFITASRKKLEDLYGISLLEKTLRWTFTNLAGSISVPNGPFVSISSLKDSCGNTISSSDYKLVGDEDKVLRYPCYEDMVMTYTVGYDEVPEPLKIEIMRMVNWMFNHRDEDDKLKGYTYTTGQYSKKSWLP